MNTNIKISEKKLEKCMKKKPFIDSIMLEFARKEFIHESWKFIRKTLLSPNHLGKQFSINDICYEFLGLINDRKSALVRSVESNKYFEMSLNLVQEAFNLKYQNYTTGETLNFHNIELWSKPLKKKFEEDEIKLEDPVGDETSIEDRKNDSFFSSWSE